jgi:hypothetical protein
VYLRVARAGGQFGQLHPPEFPGDGSAVARPKPSAAMDLRAP